LLTRLCDQYKKIKVTTTLREKAKSHHEIKLKEMTGNEGEMEPQNQSHIEIEMTQISLLCRRTASQFISLSHGLVFDEKESLAVLFFA